MSGLMAAVRPPEYLPSRTRFNVANPGSCAQLILESQGFHSWEILESSQRVGG